MARLLLAVALLTLVLAGCLSPPQPSPSAIVSPAPTATAPDDRGTFDLYGALFVDFHVDSPCDVSEAPPELAGVTITFRAPDGRATQTTSGPIGFQTLEFGEGKSGWRYPGCRYHSAYEVTLPATESYTVTFEDAQPANDDGTGFVGIELMGEHVITRDELEANSFARDFEVEPAYVPVH